MISSPSPSNELTPAATAVSILGDGEGDLVGQFGRPKAVAVAFAVTVVVTVDLRMTGVAVVVVVTVTLRLTGAAVVVVVTMTVAVSVLLGDVEPDVRLKMTSPASMKNGVELPLVLFKQVLVNGFMLPQQNKGLPSTYTRLIPLRTTVILTSAEEQ